MNPLRNRSLSAQRRVFSRAALELAALALFAAAVIVWCDAAGRAVTLIRGAAQ